MGSFSCYIFFIPFQCFTKTGPDKSNSFCSVTADNIKMSYEYNGNPLDKKREFLSKSVITESLLTTYVNYVNFVNNISKVNVNYVHAELMLITCHIKLRDLKLNSLNPVAYIMVTILWSPYFAIFVHGSRVNLLNR